MKLEIEIKARLRDREETIRQLEARGCVFDAISIQDDTVFVQKTGSLAEYLSNDVFMRIRIQNGDRTILTAKKPVRKSAEVLVKHEHETVVESAEQTKAILELLGYTAAVHTVKSRQAGHVGEYEVCLDEIEGLGSFIELEKMGDAADAEHIQAHMGEFLVSLGVAPEDRVTKGYDILMVEKEISAQ